MDELIKWLSQNKDVVQSFTSLLAVIIAFISIVLAFLSIVLAYKTLKMNAKHLRLSVKPIADMIAQDYEDNLCIKLENKGNGPLIIKAFRAIKKGQIKSTLIEWMPSLPEGIYWSNFHYNFEDTAIRPSESLILIELSIDINNKQQRKLRDIIRKELSQIDVELDYTDMYNQPELFPRHSLNYFARNL